MNYNKRSKTPINLKGIMVIQEPLFPLLKIEFWRLKRVRFIGWKRGNGQSL